MMGPCSGEAGSGELDRLHRRHSLDMPANPPGHYHCHPPPPPSPSPPPPPTPHHHLDLVVVLLLPP
ncbi:hypothetical protein E2C01_034430 [Portunus trituberculatus]|uniref:Uncharacterized protein n=1 Tax=Portunus trituberculatus TaxID=210409 RepID=A0A5B7F680_PORTR|nr:hypothetical protein [Portunus trituberculatus]